MKRIALIIATALCLVGCRKESEDLIVGAWARIDYHLYKGRVELDYIRPLGSWVFQEDGRGAATLAEESKSLFFYEREGDLLVLHYLDSTTETYTITQLNGFLKVERRYSGELQPDLIFTETMTFMRDDW